MLKPKSIISQIKFYFSFTNSEKRGILFLFCLIIILMMVNQIILPRIHSSGTPPINNFNNELALLESSIDTSSVNQYNKKEDFDFNNSDRSFAEIKLNPFPFNPNELQKEQFLKLGLNEKQTNTILNYLAKGGKFYKKEDFKKMYCITEEEFRILEPYITIPEKQNANQTNNIKFEKKEKPLFVVDANSADTNDLQEIKGIGPAFARRIAKYRDLLGGFVRKEQILEVFGMDTAKYQQIQASFIINPASVQKININKASIQDLKKHPYFDYYTAKSIVMYRTKNGEFKYVSDIKKANLIYDDFYERISPYLTVN